MSGNIVGDSGLWEDARVEWVGPEQEYDGVRLRPGDRAVVVDPGVHRITSFAVLRADGEHPGATTGVVIETPDGRQAEVAREHLRLLPPDHPLSVEPDGSVADWLLEQLASWGRGGVPVAADVPRSLPAVCRVLHP